MYKYCTLLPDTPPSYVTSHLSRLLVLSSGPRNEPLNPLRTNLPMVPPPTERTRPSEDQILTARITRDHPPIARNLSHQRILAELVPPSFERQTSPAFGQRQKRGDVLLVEGMRRYGIRLSLGPCTPFRGGIDSLPFLRGRPGNIVSKFRRRLG